MGMNSNYGRVNNRQSDFLINLPRRPHRTRAVYYSQLRLQLNDIFHHYSDKIRPALFRNIYMQIINSFSLHLIIRELPDQRFVSRLPANPTHRPTNFPVPQYSHNLIRADHRPSFYTTHLKRPLGTGPPFSLLFTYYIRLSYLHPYL